LEKEREAEKIIKDARNQAEQIKLNAQKEAEEVSKKTYQKTIDDAKQKSVEIKEKARNDAEAEAQIFLKRAEKMKKKIRNLGEQKFDEAVDSVLHEIMS
jgi:vacuolar-type H+-ATPase subunit H